MNTKEATREIKTYPNFLLNTIPKHEAMMKNNRFYLHLKINIYVYLELPPQYNTINWVMILKIKIKNPPVCSRYIVSALLMKFAPKFSSLMQIVAAF